MLTKTCTKCGETKEAAEYYKHSSGRLHYWCKACQSEYKRKRRSTPEGRKAYHNTHLKHKYGITLAQYDEMFEAQDGRCAICGADEPSGRNRHFAVDHCHKTNEVRGLLCGNCNTALGLLGDNIENLTTAILYLAKTQQENEDEVLDLSDGNFDDLALEDDG